MKKFRKILLLFAILAFLPIGVNAKEKINVYLFRKTGCGYCEKALTFFTNLSQDSEYKNYFQLVEKEVSGSKENSNLMAKTAKVLNKEVSGVPFIVIGEESFIGYSNSYDDSIKEAIKNAYESENYKDIVAPMIKSDTKESNSAAITIIILVVSIAGVGFLVYMARENENSYTEKPVKEQEVEVKVEEIKKESPKKTTVKKTTTKKTSTTKKTTTAKKNNTSKKTTNKK